MCRITAVDINSLLKRDIFVIKMRHILFALKSSFSLIIHHFRLNISYESETKEHCSFGFQRTYTKKKKKKMLERNKKFMASLSDSLSHSGFHFNDCNLGSFAAPI